jgi:hypothetical protein
LIPQKNEKSTHKRLPSTIIGEKMNFPEECINSRHIYLPRLKYHKEIENMNRPIVNKDIKPVIKCLPSNSGPYGFPGEFYQTFKELIPKKLKRR